MSDKKLTASVLIITYKRAKYLRNALDSLCKQTVKPDEVIIVLKPSNDGSEKVIMEFVDKLVVKLLIQKGVGAIDAYSQGINYASCDVILFLDDDAIAEADWVKKYVCIFNENPRVGGITGLTIDTEIINNTIKIKGEQFYEDYAEGFHRQPLEILNGYFEYFSTSGLFGASRKLMESNKEIIKSISFGGLNMGFRRFLIKDFPLKILYKGSKKAFWFEKHLALNVVVKGYDAIKVRERKKSPIVYHTLGVDSLTRSKGFWHEFWLNYDRAMNYWRIKMYGLKCSFIKYIIGQIIISRKKFLPRFSAFLYTFFLGFYYYLKYRKLVRHYFVSINN
ncbi:MAG: glycosyltransferase family 2 protein [Nitrososphaeria archaeon]|nr:glycosyltransferase family 2 protein [Nitrososphaeria archaeon]